MPDQERAGPPRPEDDRVEVMSAVARAEAGLFGGALRPVRFGRYDLDRRIGAGGLGVVYAARDPSLDRTVALKVLRAGPAAGGADQRLSREARAMARLAHPNVVAIHDVGADRGLVFVAMELVDGWTLRTWLAEQRPAWRAILEALVQAGRGLAAAHAAGLVHRDLKPENVLVGRDGRVRVTDFGLAAPLGADAPSGGGTPAYMAPEQQAGQPASPAADQLAFCVTAWESLTGRRPVRDSGSEPPAAPPDLPAAVPPAVWRVLRRGLSADPGARWPDMESLLRAFERAARRPRRTVAIALVVGAVVVLGAAGLQMWTFYDWMDRPARPPAAQPSGP